MNAVKAGFAALLCLALGACAAHADGQTSDATAKPGVLRAFAAFAYPGAKPIAPTAFATADADGARAIAGFTTGDSFDAVYAYYQRRLPAGSETLHVSGAKGSVASFDVAPRGDAGRPRGGAHVAVQISSVKPNATEILITRYRR